MTTPDPDDRGSRGAEPVGAHRVECGAAPLGADHRRRGAEPVGAGLERALAAAYRYLNRRERTQAEMRAQLSRAGTDPEDVERAVATLVEQGYLDDRRFVRLFVQDKRELEDWGSDRIRQALLAKGVDRHVVEDALGEQESGSEIERAVALLRRRFPAPAGDRRERDRALGMLIRKGYDSELALDAIAAHTRHRDDV
jgi:regulatory protein